MANAVALAGALAASPEVHACFARQVFRFDVGRVDTDADGCVDRPGDDGVLRQEPRPARAARRARDVARVHGAHGGGAGGTMRTMTMKRTTLGISRRALMKTFAGIGVGAPLFKGLLRDALAQTMPTYPRFIVLNNPHGCAADLLAPARARRRPPPPRPGWTLAYDPDSSLGPARAAQGLDRDHRRARSQLQLRHGRRLPRAQRRRVAPLTGRHARAIENADSMRTTGPSIDTFLADQLQTEPFLFNPTGYSGSNLGITFDMAGERVGNEYDLPHELQEVVRLVHGPDGDARSRRRRCARRPTSRRSTT